MLKLIGLTLTFVACVNGAAITFSLDQPVASASKGDFVVFSGTITNVGIDTAYLNGALGSLPFSDLLVDYTAFFTAVPASLAVGEFYAGEIFGVSVGLFAGAGDYFGSFTIQGGADAFSFDDMSTQSFQVNVASVPEPGTGPFVLAGFVCAVLGGFSRRFRHR